MSDEELNRRPNPLSFLTGPTEPFDAVAIPITPPPRPFRRPSVPPEPPPAEALEALDYGAIPLPSDEPEPLAEPARPEDAAPPPAVGGAALPLDPLRALLELAALVARIESAVGVIHAALAEIKRLQSPPGAAS
jgi:hypothetical protein